MAAVGSNKDIEIKTGDFKNQEIIEPIKDTFPIGEAFIDCIYGKIRQGKTYTGTASVWNYLVEGNVVYASWPIDFDGYDERKIWWMRWLGKIGLKKWFLVIPKENLHTFNLMEMSQEEFFTWFASLTDCIVIVDEAQWIFDSYIKTMMEKEHRTTLFATGHFNRALKVITQRPMQIHISIRGNIARYYKVEKTFEGWWFIPPRFKLTEFQELKTTDAVPDESIDEETGEYKYAESVKRFFLNFKVAGRYNNKYLRGDMAPSQKNLAYFIKMKIKNLWKKKS